MNAFANPINSEFLLEFFKLGTIINCGIMIVWSFFILVFPDMIYKTHTRFLKMPKETFNALMYAFLGLYKIVITAFFVVPYLTLLIMTAAGGV